MSADGGVGQDKVDVVGPLVLVMGVSGSGKSTIGALLARCLGVPFCEGDDLHPAANIAKMRAGRPLSDHDRMPWLDQVEAWLHGHDMGGVAACSALRRPYRDHLRRRLPGPLRTVFLDPPADILERRLLARKGHFMPAPLRSSQFAALERPDPDENAIVLRTSPSPKILVAEIMARIACDGEGER